MIGCEVTFQDFDGSKDKGLLAQYHSLCCEVFCKEYDVEELLGIDRNTTHIAARWIGDGSVIATCRLYLTHPYVKLDQVAVHKVCFTFTAISSFGIKFIIFVKLMYVTSLSPQ